MARVVCEPALYPLLCVQALPHRVIALCSAHNKVDDLLSDMVTSDNGKSYVHWYEYESRRTVETNAII